MVTAYQKEAYHRHAGWQSGRLGNRVDMVPANDQGDHMRDLLTRPATAFLEWPDRRVRSYEEWACLNIERPVFAPGLSPLAFQGERLVGAVLSLDSPESDEGYVHSVAVHRDYRNRGIARSLLVHAFRGFHRQRRRRCVLWTHSDTGALSLYEKIGMTVRRISTHFSRSLTDG